jgi:hypothetical protein
MSKPTPREIEELRKLRQVVKQAEAALGGLVDRVQESEMAEMVGRERGVPEAQIAEVREMREELTVQVGRILAFISEGNAALAAADEKGTEGGETRPSS